MKLFEVIYMAKNEGLCANDFKREPKKETINLEYFASLSDLEMFRTPLTDKEVEKFAILTMSNGDQYYIGEFTYERLKAHLDSKKNQ